jgi:methionine sulfoxide reductase heme-binding subunit
MMVSALSSSDPKILWFLNRSTGIVLLVTLTLSMIFGILATERDSPSWWPRFVTNELHRRFSLLAVALLIVHAGTAIADNFVDISLIDAVIPYASPYRPTWLALGTIASDVMIAVIITSVLRHRLGHSGWWVTHRLSYLSWPLAVVHGTGTGTDTRQPWAYWVVGVCVGAVVIIAAARLLIGGQLPGALRSGLLIVVVVFPLVLVLWLRSGPLAPGWSKKAGTPPPPPRPQPASQPVSP